MLFGQTVPVLRAVVTEEGVTFEGEWFIPEFGDDSPLIRLTIAAGPTAPPRPTGGGVRTFGGGGVVPAR